MCYINFHRRDITHCDFHPPPVTLCHTTSDTSLSIFWTAPNPYFLDFCKRECRTWLGLYLDDKISFSSESCLSSCRVLKEQERYPYHMAAFAMTDWSWFLSSALRYLHQAGLAYRMVSSLSACLFVWYRSQKMAKFGVFCYQRATE